MKHDVNHDHTHHSSWSWEALFEIDPDFTTAALMLGESYGYETKHLEPVNGFKIICGFVEDDLGGGLGGGDGGGGVGGVGGASNAHHSLWDCRLERGAGAGAVGTMAAPRPTMMHPKHFTPPPVKKRVDSRLKGEDPFNLGTATNALKAPFTLPMHVCAWMCVFSCARVYVYRGVRVCMPCAGESSLVLARWPNWTRPCSPRYTFHVSHSYEMLAKTVYSCIDLERPWYLGWVLMLVRALRPPIPTLYSMR